jgi:hypothetical protein
VDPQEAEKLLALDEQALYEMLVPASQQVFSKEGMVAKGRSIFASRLAAARGAVCRQYTERGANVRNSIDLTVLVGAALLAAPAMDGIPILPMAALIVKIGLEEVCRKDGASASSPAD